MEALRERQTRREFKLEPLPAQTVADLLWAGFGINRQGTGHRTAPSAMNTQEIDVYVFLAQGVYLYDPKRQALKPLSGKDLRAQTSGEKFAGQAPLTLLYVADLARFTRADQNARKFYAAFDAGCICQNVYLFCASRGLATVVHELDRAPLISALRLRPEQQIILAQAVGYPQAGSAETRH
jgi:nitroreductase